MKYLWPDAVGYGLPGGHLEAGEDPDEAIRRELKEETGIEGIKLTRRDFWAHEDGKIVLGYTGKLETVVPLSSSEPGSVTEWRPLSDIANEVINVGSYKEFILSNRPERKS